MKAIRLAIVALCAQFGLAVPHGRFQGLRRRYQDLPPQDHHQHRHAPRALQTAYGVYTEIVTVTASHAVVWVDQHGNVLSTDYPGYTAPPIAATSVSSSSSTTSTHTSSQVTSTPTTSSIPTTTTSSTVPTTTTTTPAPTTAPPSTTASSAAPSSSSVANEGKTIGNMGGLGVCYELIDSSVQCKSSAVLNSEFAFLKSQGFSRVRVYDIGCPLGVVAAAAAQNGISLIAGLNTVGNVAGDLAKLINMVNNNWAPFDTIVIGNEVVNNNPGAVSAVVAGLSTARSVLGAAGFKGNIVTVDTFIAHASHPELCAASDYCAVNAYAYFDANTVAQDAGNFVLNTAIAMVQKIANGKQIVVTESGWPWQGQTNGKAVPSRENQQTAIASLKSTFAGSSIPLFLFQAYDASYKAPGHLGVEPFFGIYGS